MKKEIAQVPSKMFGLLDVNDSLEELEKTMLCNKKTKFEMTPC